MNDLFLVNLINGISTTRIKVHVCVVYCDYVLTGGFFCSRYVSVYAIYFFVLDIVETDGKRRNKEMRE